MLSPGKMQQVAITLLKMVCCGSKLLPVFRPKWSKNR